jgi:hypothetical protein
MAALAAAAAAGVGLLVAARPAHLREDAPRRQGKIWSASAILVEQGQNL